jgi:methionyl aminopeptidase
MNRVPIKAPADVERMRGSCRITAEVLKAVEEIIRPGISTEEVNQFCHRMITDAGGVPSPLGYKGYPKSVCISPNDVICHGIPAPFTILQSGDIVNVDVTTYKDGYHGDASRMYFVGGEEACSAEAVTLVNVTRDALYAAIREVRPGKRIGDIGAAIQEQVRNSGHTYGIVREYTGHGIGREFHEPPQVLHVGRRGTGDVMKPGMTFTIEPMINGGSHRTVLSKIDGWTVRTADGSLSAQWEHTVLVTETGVEILTEL